ncbi:MAG: glycosyltransferase family 39 protein [bacterium]|nr:glycosyltransferase family 39 protein [bacterium]
MKRLFSSHLAILLCVWTAVAVYLAVRADHSWIAHDEGLLAQSAERVLDGQLPHRDFDDAYTGGLSLLHAAAFRLLGIKLTSLRWVLLVFSLAFTAAVYGIASRVSRPVVCALVTLLCVAWSVPIYFAGMPSWYNLFCAAFGTLALLRHIETDKRRWLLIAGLCCGISILIKVIGLFFTAAVLLFLLYREQTLTESDPDTDPPSAAFKLLSGTALLVFCGLLASLVSRRPSAFGLFQFLLPGLALAVFLLWNESRLRHGGLRRRWARLRRLGLPFGLGVILPIAVYLVPYLTSSALPDLWNGVFILPLKRFELVAMAPSLDRTLAAAVPLTLLLGAPLALRAKASGRTTGMLLTAAVGAAVAVTVFGDQQAVYRGVWHSIRPLVPVVTILGCLTLSKTLRAKIVRPATPRRQQLFLLLATAGMGGLVQYPNAFWIYFCYVAPLVVLAILFLVGEEPPAWRRIWIGVLAFYLLFAVVWLHRGFVLTTGVRYWQVDESARLELDRGGLRVAPRIAAAYEGLVAVVNEHSPPGSFIYATPDCPEVYFLSRRRNPTRTFYEIFEPDYRDDPRGRNRRLLAMLEAHDVDLVVLHWSPKFSDPIGEDLLAEIRARYPHGKAVRPFTVHWRERAP